MFKKLMVIILGILSIGLTGCKLETPEIRGVVLDAETKQPIENGWVHATIWIKAKTVAGDVGKVISLESPHTRTGKDGRFGIPQRELEKAPFPVGFGTQIDKFTITVATIDKSASKEINIKDLDKKEIAVTIYMEDIEKVWQKELQHVSPGRFQQEKEMREFSGLQALYNYCLAGRFSVEVPSVEGGCDEWELDYVIAKHERYLERNREKSQTRSHNSIILEQLGLLYERKGEYEKAIANLKKAREMRFFRPQDLDDQIKRIQRKLHQTPEK